MTGSERPADTLVTAPRGFVADSRMVLMAGVAGACLLGAAAGAWVRPEADDLKGRDAVRSIARTSPAATPPPQLRIVMDAEMLPARPPMEVLPAWTREAEALEPPFAAAPLDEAPVLRLVGDEEPAPPPKAETPKPKRVEKAKPAKVQVAKAEKTKAKAEKSTAKSETKLAKVDKAKKAKETKLAKTGAAKKKGGKTELAKAEKPKKPSSAKPGKVMLAKAEPKKPAKPAAKDKPKAAKSVLLAKAPPKPEKPKVERPKAPEKPPAVLAAAKPVPPSPRAEPPARIAKATTKAPIPQASGVQQARRAENPWADEDHRLARAYRRAAEAGVPEWRLERQQARWRQARDAAEREAPWAVRRVYDARIAELDDLAGEAAMAWN